MRVLLIRLIAIFSLLASVGGCASMSWPSPLDGYEQSMVFQPSRFPEGNWQPAGLRFEDVWFTAADGTRLHGWYVPHKNPRAVALFAHGNAGNLSHRAGSLQILHDRHQLSVMIFDYRGYGRSEGTPDERGLLEDARAARSWLSQRAGVAERDILLMGRSLGGAIMVDLASHDGARGLVLASTFTSLPDVAAHHLPLLPARWLMKNRLDSLSKIGEYKGPLLISHGDADRTIPYSHGRKLYEQAGGLKQFVTIAGGDHNTPQPAHYRETFDAFLDGLP